MVIPVTREIELSQGKTAIIDAADYELVNQYKWHVNRYGYAVCNKYLGNYRSVAIYMHRLILDSPKGMVTDHINHDRLDNRRSNIRVCTQAENMSNVSLRKDNTSGAKGVRWHKQLKKWNARIHVKGKEISLGCYHDLSEARRAYDTAAIKYFGEFANPNQGEVSC